MGYGYQATAFYFKGGDTMQNIYAEYENILRLIAVTEKALEDFEGAHAILMCLMQAGESLNKVKNDEIKKQLPVAGVYGLRNIIVHDYEGINLKQIQETLKTHLPELKAKIRKIIETNRI